MVDLNDNAAIAELARQQSLETGRKVYAVDANGKDAVYIDGRLLYWTMLDDIEIIFGADDAWRWVETMH